MSINKIHLYSSEKDLVQLGKRRKQKDTISYNKNAAFYRGISSMSLFPVKVALTSSINNKQFGYIPSSYDSLRIAGDWTKIGNYIRKSAEKIHKTRS